MRNSVSISLDDKLLSDIDRICKETHNTRSNFIRGATVNAIQQHDAIQALTQFNAIASAFAKQGGALDEEQKEELRKIQNVVNAFSEVVT